MDYTPINIRTLSILGQRGTLGVTLTDLAEQNDRIVALTADLCNTSGLDRFKEAFPSRLYNVGIAEQNMVGIAAGMAAGGNIPFATTFANFAALRSCEQIRHFLGYMRENVKVVGFAAGFSMGMFGITHYGTEDIAALRGIDNITILSPADGLEAAKAILAASEIKAPVYLRLTGGMNMPIVYKCDYNYKIGKAITLSEGADIAIVATGTMVYNSLKAAAMLEKDGLTVKVIDMHTIKPLDTNAIDELHEHKLIVSVEEHNIIGGLGSAISEYLSAKIDRPPLLMIGVRDSYKCAGDYKYLIEQHGLSINQIYNNIKIKYSEVIK